MKRAIISGGGTGGHIFPALSIAQEIKRRYPECEILFVGAKGRMEMTKIPAAGYPIEGLWISGIQRKLSLDNMLFPVKLLWSLVKARGIIRRFKPEVVIGTGGYASAPILHAASSTGIPTVIQEQNGFAGITNKWLSGKVDRICVAYNGLEKVFPKEKIILTGNPVRGNITAGLIPRDKAVTEFGFDPNKKIILSLGGSLGARAVNACIFAHLDKFVANDTQLLWQCGRLYYEEYATRFKELADADPRYNQYIRLVAFIEDMDTAYSVADCIISRAGASTVSEMCIVGKPAILVPSPNVAEDHQTHNARALSDKEAAILIPEAEMNESLPRVLFDLLRDTYRIDKLSKNIRAMARPNATGDIVDIIETLVEAD